MALRVNCLKVDHSSSGPGASFSDYPPTAAKDLSSSMSSDESNDADGTRNDFNKLDFLNHIQYPKILNRRRKTKTIH